VEILYGYPIDAVVLTTGCDKTTPAGVMAASTVDIPAIVLSGGPMLDGWHEGQLVGSGTVIWRSRRQLAAGELGQAREIEQMVLGEQHQHGADAVIQQHCLDPLGRRNIGAVALDLVVHTEVFQQLGDQQGSSEQLSVSTAVFISGPVVVTCRSIAKPSRVDAAATDGCHTWPYSWP